MNLDEKKFFTVPKPFEDELLSSWLIRTALRHKTNPAAFMNTHFQSIKPDFWSRDVDIFWSTQSHFINKLSYKSNIPVQILTNMSLQAYTGYLSEKIHTNTRNKLIVPLVKRGRTNQGKGIRYCPKCLEEDKEPYFRKYWRLSFVTVCPKHQCFLENCCPECHSPVTHYKIQSENDFGKCHNCNTSLYKNNHSIPVPAHSYGIQAQENLLSILHSGMFKFNDEEYLSLAFFPVLKQIGKLIYSFGLRKMVFGHESLATTVDLPKFKKKPSVLVEDISIQEQYIIYSASEYILQSPKKLHLFCKENHIGKGILTHSMNYIPYWFTFIVSQNDISYHSISRAEAKSAILYLKKHRVPISFASLSRLVGSTLEARKRKDISSIIKTYQDI